MVKLLSLGLPSSSPTENRVLSIKLVELILRWEERRKRLKAEAAEKGEGDDGTTRTTTARRAAQEIPSSGVQARPRRGYPLVETNQGCRR